MALVCFAPVSSATPLRPQFVPTNTGLAHQVPYVTNVPEPGPASAFRVSEAKKGSRDLNGDEDSGDDVWRLILPERTPQNLGAAFGTPFWIAGRRVVFAVTESAQGAGSLNGDGDTGDVVMHYVDVP